MLFTHKRLAQTLATICILVLLSPLVALAQDGITTKKLREQIALIEKIVKDPTTSEEVRALNRELLAEKRAQLATRLTKEIDNLRQELDGLQSTSSPASASMVLTSTVQPNITSNSTAPAPVANSDPPVVSNGTSSTNTSADDPFIADCFSDAPQGLNNTAVDAAGRIVAKRDASNQFGDLMFYSLTYAVAIEAGREDLLKQIEVEQLKEQTRRTDKQIGAGANAAGSTSAIDKPNFAEILGFAVEHGAIQQAINGTTLTLSTTPYLFTTLKGQDIETNFKTPPFLNRPDTQSNYQKYGYLTRLGISASFNIENQDNPLASARRQQLTDWSVRLRLSGDRSTRSVDAEKIWRDKVEKSFVRPSLVITDALAATFQTDPELEAQRRQLSDRFQGLAAEQSTKAILDNKDLSAADKQKQIATIIVCRIKDDVVSPIVNGTGTFKISQESKDRLVRVTLPAFSLAVKAKTDALADFKKGMDELALKPIFSLAYNNIRPPFGSNFSELKVLYQKKAADPISLIANGGVSFYNKPNDLLRQKTVRDFSVSLALEGTLGKSPFMVESKDESQMTYSFTGRYERFFENQYFAGRKADIAVAQFKFEIPIAAGMSFPFSVTYANSTELIQEKNKVRANFGFTFDTDKLLKALALSRLP